VDGGNGPADHSANRSAANSATGLVSGAMRLRH
jgi:hypothetical protein